MRIFPPEHVTWEKGHGRIEKRSIQTSTLLNDYLLFPHVEQVFKIERIRQTLKGEPLSQEIVYGITSLSADCVSQEQLLTLNRDHWSIENRLHWVRDVTFDEDRSQVRTKNGPRVMASLRNLAISLIRLCGAQNIAKALRYFSRNANRVMAFIGL